MIEVLHLIEALGGAESCPHADIAACAVGHAGHPRSDTTPSVRLGRKKLWWARLCADAWERSRSTVQALVDDRRCMPELVDVTRLVISIGVWNAYLVLCTHAEPYGSTPGARVAPSPGRFIPIANHFLVASMARLCARELITRHLASIQDGAEQAAFLSSFCSQAVEGARRMWQSPALPPRLSAVSVMGCVLLEVNWIEKCIPSVPPGNGMAASVSDIEAFEERVEALFPRWSNTASLGVWMDFWAALPLDMAQVACMPARARAGSVASGAMDAKGQDEDQPPRGIPCHAASDVDEQLSARLSLVHLCLSHRSVLYGIFQNRGVALDETYADSMETLVKDVEAFGAWASRTSACDFTDLFYRQVEKHLVHHHVFPMHHLEVYIEQCERALGGGGGSGADPTNILDAFSRFRPDSCMGIRASLKPGVGLARPDALPPDWADAYACQVATIMLFHYTMQQMHDVDFYARYVTTDADPARCLSRLFKYMRDPMVNPPPLIAFSCGTWYVVVRSRLPFTGAPGASGAGGHAVESIEQAIGCSNAAEALTVWAMNVCHRRNGTLASGVNIRDTLHSIYKSSFS